MRGHPERDPRRMAYWCVGAPYVRYLTVRPEARTELFEFIEVQPEAALLVTRIREPDRVRDRSLPTINNNSGLTHSVKPGETQFVSRQGKS